MIEYEVTWGVSLDADSPRQAAERALEMLRSSDPANIALVFQVADHDNPEVTIDLSPGAGTEDVDLSTDRTACMRCGHPIEDRDGTWVATDATGDDEIWAESCPDNHRDRIAAHEPEVVIPLDDPRLAGFEAPLEGHGSCVVCLVGNHDTPHDPADHQAVDVHLADGVPTSEACPGVTCPDCEDVLAQVRGE